MSNAIVQIAAGRWQRARARAVRVLVLAALAGLALHSVAGPHRYDHVVIVIEENRTVGQIIGDTVDAPYINFLANNGVKIGGMYGITHPSQPNYIHLFSGGDQGIVTDGLPPNFSTTATATYPFRAPNVGSEILGAGFTFSGFSEGIEAAGTNDWADYAPSSTTSPGIYYRRRHAPWVNWVAKQSPIPSNQVPSAVNLSFTNFPADFRNLPTVSFVIPNLQHDMHDGSRKMGDDWLQANLGAYALWARTNNSLLIVMWDEDDFANINQIATVLYGAGLRNGAVVGGTWTHHNMLRTLEDMYGSTVHAGSAAQVRPIVGAFLDDPPVTNAVFQQGVNGYSGTRDTAISAAAPAANNAAELLLTSDLDTDGATAGNQEAEVLVRFDGIFGSAAGQVPTNAILQSAKLLLFTPLSPTNQSYESTDVFRAHRMLAEWTDTATWTTFGAGVSADNVDAASAATFSLVPAVDGAPQIIDVTVDVELFRAGTTNRGWVIRPSSTGTGNGWTIASSEYTNVNQRPKLEIVYTVPRPYDLWAAARGLTAVNNTPSADPDGDGLPNLSEFACNLNPLVRDSGPIQPGGTNGIPAARFLANTDGGVLEVEFVRRKGATAAGLSYTVEFSSDAQSGWTAGQAPVATSLNADWERVTVRDSVSGPNASRFGRVIFNLQ